MRASAVLAALCLLVAWAGPARPADRSFQTSDGVRLHYIEQAAPGARQDRTLVFVPGWTMPAWIWTPQLLDFARRYRTVALDPRSQGDSEIAPSGHEPVRRGQDIAELIAQLGPAPVVLVGWSLGVLDTLAYVRTHGDRQVAGLVLVDNSVGEEPAPSAPPPPRRRGPVLSRDAEMRRFVRSMFLRPQPPGYLDRLTAAALRTPPSAAAALLAYPVPRSYWKDAIYATEKPILYVVRPGLAGQAANLAAHHEGAETVVLPGVGHALFVDEPARFDALLDSFLRRRVWR